MIYIFDICNTLFASNTTYDFIKFFLDKNKSAYKKQLFLLITDKFSPFFYLFAICSKISGLDIHKALVLLLLKGFSKDFLYKSALDFYDEILVNKKISETMSFLNNVKKKPESKIILISSTIDPVAEAIKQRLSENVISTILSYKNNICTGKVSVELTGRKEEFAPLTGRESYVVVTDNFSDYKIVKGATERYIVIYKAKEKKKWEKLKPIFISPGA